MAEPTKAGSATVQAGLWGERARDWAEVMEGERGWGIPVYRHVLERVPIGPDTRVLDVGCGAGRFCRLAADRGARIAGLDATPAFIEHARSRTPGGDFRVGDMEALPWPDGVFDLVTGFNSFFMAASMERALREAGRVARPGGFVALSVFGRPERCDSTAVFQAVRALLPPDPAGPKPTGPALHEEGVLEAMAERAGLHPHEAGYLAFEERYADLDSVVRGMTAMVRADRSLGIEPVRAAVAEALRPGVTPDGSCRLLEEVRYLIAHA
jgi:SAM-dependent methyltransferase